MPNLLTASQIAAELNLRPSTIMKWSREGFIPAVRISSRTVRYDADDVQQALRLRAEERARSGR